MNDVNITRTVDAIRSELLSAFRERCLKPDMGFQDTRSNGKWDIPWDSIVTRVDVSYVDDDNVECDPASAYYARIEVGVELGYDGMLKISEAGDQVLVKYDPDAYFDFDEPGIMSAYLTLSTLGAVTSSTSIRAARDYIPDPVELWPEGREPGPELDWYDAEAEIDLKLDAVILIDSDGSWEYEDTTYPWAKSNTSRGDWYADTDYGDVYIGDATTIVEYVDSLLETLLPIKKGRFYIQGYPDLFFNISDISGISKGYGVDEDGDPIIDTDYFLDDADVEFDFSKSKISDFTINEIK